MQPVSEAGRDRLVFVDVAKGIGILLVVYGHVARGLQAASLAPRDGLLGAIDYVIYAAHMPLFFVLSGLFFDRSADWGGFWRGRVTALAYPYFVWSLLQGGAQLAVSGSGAVNGDLPVSALLAIPWAPISPFWFLYALFFANLLLFALRRVDPALVTGGALVLFGALAVAGIGGVVNDIAYGLLYFSAGALLARYRLVRFVPSRVGWAVGLLLVYVTLSLVAHAGHVPERLPIPAAIAGVLALLSLSRAIAAAGGRWLVGGLGLLGVGSMSIYVMHVTAIGVTRLLLMRLFGIDSVPVLLAGCTLAAVLAPIAVHLLLLRLGVSRWFGLPAPAQLRAVAGRILPGRALADRRGQMPM